MPAQTPQTLDPSVPPVLSERLGYLFAKLHHRWLNESASILQEAGLGLSGLHFGALSVIEAAGPISQQTLGEYLKKDRTSIVGVIDELEAEGLVERRRNPSDRRAYALQVTAQGRRWLKLARPLLTAAEEALMSALSAAEKEQLVTLLQRVLFGPSPADS